MNAPIPPAALSDHPDLDELVKDDRVRTTLYTDEALFKEEMEKIFSKTWVWVAHVSEVPQAGNFKMAKVGLEPVVVVRDRKGEINVLLNRCRHRAATVCESRKGKTSSFVCPYHGWAFGLDGALRGVPYEEVYGPDFDRAEFGLRRLKVGIYNGLIFASFNEDVEPLEEFLGAARKWIDLFMKQSAGFPMKVMGEHRFTFPGNWKIQLENTTDAYHFPITHRPFLEASDAETNAQFDLLSNGGWVEELGNGHSVMVMMPERVDLDELQDQPWPSRYQPLYEELRETYDEAEARRITHAAGGGGFNLNLFPNLGCSLQFFRVLQPLEVDKTEVHHLALGMEGGPAAANLERMRAHEFFQGPMGFGTPDDAEAWDRVQKGAQGGSDLYVMVNRSIVNSTETPDGTVRSDVSSEGGMRSAYRQWKKMMEVMP